MAAALEVSVEQGQLTALAARLAAAEDGKRLRLDLIRNLRAAVAPAVAEVQAGARSISGEAREQHTRKNIAAGVATSLGDAIARGVSTQVRLKGRTAGVSVKARKKGMPREFPNAPKRVNARKWRHKVFGHDVWVDQVGHPGFFDRPLHDKHAVYRAACVQAMEEMAQRIAR